ncbi:MAG: YCF48-related protein [Cyclobacteriaceae bacterium]
MLKMLLKKSSFFLTLSMLWLACISNAQEQENWYQQGKWTVEGPSTSSVWWYTIHYYNSDLVFLAGSGGNVGKSEDGGASWEFINTGYDFGIQAVTFISESVGWAVGGNSLVLKTVDGGETWQKVEITLFEEIDYAQDIHFVDSNTGYLCGKTIEGEGFVYKTTDGGDTWVDINSTESFASFFMLMVWDDANTGWLASSQFELFKTTDGGDTWDIKHAANESWGVIRHLSFFGDIGYVVTAEGFVDKTIDGGETWNPTNDSIDVDFTFSGYDPPWAVQSAFFVDENKGFAVDDDENIHTTIDGGDNWSGPDPIGDGSFFFSIKFYDKNNGLAVGRSGLILKTTDGGDTWENLRNNTRTINDLTVVENTGYAVGASGTILKSSTEEPNNWSKLTTVTAEHLHAISFLNEQKGWAVGTSGTLLSTTNAGETWGLQSLPSTAALRDIQVSTSQFGLIVGDMEDSIFLTVDEGQSWQHISTGVNTSLNAVSIPSNASEKAWATGDAGVILSSVDGGLSWNSQNSTTSENLHDIYFLSDTLGWAVGDSATIIKTVDGGSTWIEQESPVRYYVGVGYPAPDYLPVDIDVAIDLHAVFFIDENIGYAVGSPNDDAAMLLFTIDGGETWEMLEDEYNVATDINAVLFTSPGNGLVAGNNGLIINYKNQLPFISEFSSDEGVALSEVFLYGYNFETATSVLFNDVQATFTVVNDQTISAIVPQEATSGFVTVTNDAGTVDSWKQFQISTITEFENELLQSLEVFPNPSQGDIQINLGQHFGGKEIKIEVHSHSGSLVRTYSQTLYQGNTLNLNMKSLAPGFYTLRIQSDQQMVSKKIIVR